MKQPAYSYVRMSTENQLRGDSLRRQTELSAAYAAQHGLEMVEGPDFHDLGISAYDGENVRSGALGRFLAAVTSGRVAKGSYLLVESLDRLSRQKPQAAVRLFLDIIESGINIVTLSDNHVYRAGEADLSQLIYSLVVMSRAHEESETKSQRLSAAWESKRRQAGDKKLTGLCPRWLRLSEDRTHFVALPERVRVVERIFHEAAGGSGTYLITKGLNEHRIPTFGRAAAWGQSSVTKILQSRAVLGEFQPHKLVEGRRIETANVIHGYFPAIVSEQLFLEVQHQRRLRSLGGGGRKGAFLRNLFTHLATCAYCGSPMRFVDKGKPPKGGQYLVCGGALAGLDCVRAGWPYLDFETAFLSYTSEVDLSGAIGAVTQETRQFSAEQRTSQLREKHQLLQVRRDKVFALIDEASTAYLKGRLAEVESELAVVEYEISEQSQRGNDAQVAESSAEELKAQISALQDVSSPNALKTRLAVASRLKSLVSSLTLSVEGSVPWRERAKEDLGREFAGDERLEGLFEVIDRPGARGDNSNPSFGVKFADGRLREVVLNRATPLSMVVRVDGGPEELVLRTAEGVITRRHQRVQRS